MWKEHEKTCLLRVRELGWVIPNIWLRKITLYQTIKKSHYAYADILACLLSDCSFFFPKVFISIILALPASYGPHYLDISPFSHHLSAAVAERVLSYLYLFKYFMIK